LHWAGDPEQIGSILRESGLIVEHDESLDTCIKITDPDIVEGLFKERKKVVNNAVWYRHIEDVTTLVAHHDIIKMGPMVVPLLVRELRTNPASHHWCQALAAITGENPVSEEDMGKTHRVRESWLKLAREKQWEPMIEVCVTVEVVKTETLIGTLTVQAQDAAAAQQIVEELIAKGKYDVPHTNIVWQHGSVDKQKSVSVIEAVTP
jgi:hypothetical protein